MDVHELTPAYALDALDADEREAYEAHLGRCEQCRGELASLRTTVGALAWGVESPPPPARLRARLLEAAAAERQNVVPLPLRRPWFRATAAAAAVAACAAVGLGIWAATLSHSLSSERSARARDARAAQIVADPAARKIPLQGGSGELAVDPTGRAVLVVRQLPAAPAGKTYEAWVIPPGGTAKRAGVFPGGDSMALVPLQESVPRGAVVAATVERRGGVDAPTQTPVFTAQT